MMIKLGIREELCNTNNYWNNRNKFRILHACVYINNHSLVKVEMNIQICIYKLTYQQVFPHYSAGANVMVQRRP